MIGAGSIWTLHLNQFLFFLFENLSLHLYLGLMVKPIVRGLLSFGTLRLRVEKLGSRRHFSLLNFLLYLILFMVLTLLKGLLILEELLFRSALLTCFAVDTGLESAALFLRVSLLLSHLVNLAFSLTFPSRELFVVLLCILACQFPLLKSRITLTNYYQYRKENRTKEL